LDGSRSHADLVDFLVQQVQNGVMMIHEKGVAVKDEERIRPILTKIVDETLAQLARSGLLAG